MIIKRYIFLIAFFIISFQAQAQWSVTYSLGYNYYKFKSIDFINDTIGFVALDYPPYLMKTINGGSTWTNYTLSNLALPSTGNNRVINKVQFTSDSIGYFSYRADQQMIICKTVNQGATWQQVLSVSNAWQGPLMDFYNNLYGIVAYNQIIYRTSDGGLTWVSNTTGLNIYALKVIDSTKVVFSANYPNSYYSNDFCATYTQANAPYFYEANTFKDSLGVSAYMDSVFISFNYGNSWIFRSKYAFNGAIRSLFFASPDTLLAGGDDYIFLSTDTGLTWHRQVSSNNIQAGLQPYTSMDRGTSKVFAASADGRHIIQTFNSGGAGAPNLNLAPKILGYQCPGNTIFIQNLSDSTDSYYWSLNGTIISTSYHLSYVIPANPYKDTLHIYLVGDNGVVKDSIRSEIRTLPQPKSPDFHAWLDTISDCQSGDYFIRIYPYFLDYQYYIQETISLSNFGLTLVSVTNDTAIFKTANVNYSLNYRVKSYPISSFCSGQVNDTLLTKIFAPIIYTVPSTSLSKSPYCANEPATIYVYNTTLYAKYWIQVGQITTPAQYHNGDTLVFTWPSNYSIYTVFYETPKGCIKTTNQYSIAREPINPSFYLSQQYYLVADTIFIDYYPTSLQDSCTWTLHASADSVFYTSCLDNYIIAYEEGNQSIELTAVSVNGCIYSPVANFKVDNPSTLYGVNSCDYDTGYLMRVEVADLEYDQQGNIYTAGYYTGSSVDAGTYGGAVYYFKKYDINKNVVWEKKLNLSTMLSSNNSHISSYGVSIYPDSDGSVYISGTMIGTGAEVDSTYYYTGGVKKYMAFLAKLDSTQKVVWCKLFVPSNDYSSTSSSKLYNCFTDIVKFNGSLTISTEIRWSGTIYKSDNGGPWQTDAAIFTGVYLLTIDQNGNTISTEKVLNIPGGPLLTFFDGSTATWHGMSRNTRLSIDRQNRLNMLSIYGHGNSNPIYYESIRVKDPQHGWISNNTCLIGNANGFIYNFNNKITFDSYGNRYLINNWGTATHAAGSKWVLSSNHPTQLWNNSINEAGGAISKLNVNGNVLWSKVFLKTRITDVILTPDEQHVGLSLISNGYIDIVDTVANAGINTGEFDGVYAQLSTGGILENIGEYGSKHTNPQFLYLDSGFVHLQTYTFVADSVSVTQGQTIQNFPFNNLNYFYNFISFKIQNEFGNCIGPAFSNPVSDTLFLHPDPFLNLCAQTPFFLPWVATDTINFVNIGYFLNSDTTKFYLYNNLSADDYATMWTPTGFNTLDTVTFFIEDNAGQFFHTTNNFIYYQYNLISVSDTTICQGDSLSLNHNYTFAYTWKPENYFTDTLAFNIQAGYLTFSDTLIISATANSCYFKDTVFVTVLDTAIANFTLTSNWDTVSFTNQSLNADSISWSVNGVQAGTLNNLVLQVDTQVVYIVSLLAWNNCFADTLVDTLFLHQITTDSIFICPNDSAVIFQMYQVNQGLYLDTLISTFGVDSILATELIHFPSYNDTLQSVEICNNDSILIFGNYVTVAGIYHDSLQTQFGCDSIKIINLNINNVYQFTDSLEICLGDSVMIFNSYQSAPGFYFDSLQTVNGCDSILSRKLLVHSLPQTIANASSNVVCMGEEVILSGSGALYYSWDNNVNNGIGFVPAATSVYSVTGIDANGCVDTANILISVNPVFSLAITAQICFGETYLLPGGSAVTSGGIYHDTLQSVLGCDSIFIVNLVQNTIDISVSQSTDTLSANNPNGSYQWISCDNANPVAGSSISQSYIASTNGNFAVILTENGCVDTSACYNINGIGVLENDFGNSFSVYPNPATKVLNIELGQIYPNTLVQVHDLYGKLIIIKSFNKQQLLQINIESLANGFYMLSVFTDNNKARIKLVKER